MAKPVGSSAKVRVLLVAASPVRRSGLEAVIRNAPSLELVGTVHGRHALRGRAADLLSDVVVLDVPPEASGGPPVPSPTDGNPVVVLIDAPSAEWTASALRSDVKAVLPREVEPDELVQAIHAAYAGLVLLDPETAHGLAARVPRPVQPRSATQEPLTAREVEVLRMLAEGLGNHEMAVRFGLSDHTIKFHISSILDKLGAASRTEAVTLGIRMGIVPL